MKSFKRITMIALVILFTALLCNLFGWGDDDTVSVNPGNYHNRIYYNNGWSVAAYKDTAHAVWTCDKLYDDIWYARSTDDTETWGDSIELSAEISGQNRNPSIASVGDTVHVAWLNVNSGNFSILYINSTDRGESWNDIDTVSDNINYKAGQPCIRACGSSIYIAWRDATSAYPRYDIFFDYKNHSGASWVRDQNLSNVSGDSTCYWPSMAAIGDTIDVVWQHHEPSPNNNYEIFHIRNDNCGGPEDWSSVHNVSGDANHHQMYPCVADTAGYIHVVWQESDKIWSARSTNGGSNWNERRVCSDNTAQRYPNVAVVGTNVHVVWMDDRGTDYYDIFHACSYNNGYSWDDEERVSLDNDYDSKHPSIAAITNNQDSDYRNLYVVWEEAYSVGGLYAEVLADYEQYEYKVEKEPGKGGELLPDDNAHEFQSLGFIISPNPMRSKTSIEYILPKQSSIEISVYDASGRLIRTLFKGNQNPGKQLLEWDGKNEKGEGFNPGIYFIKAGDFKATKVVKME